jgi:hypothetical protein
MMEFMCSDLYQSCRWGTVCSEPTTSPHSLDGRHASKEVWQPEGKKNYESEQRNEGDCVNRGRKESGTRTASTVKECAEC